MPVFDREDINLAALDLSDVYIVVIPPQNLVIPGVSTAIAGIVGTATRGPLNQPIMITDTDSLRRTFGEIQLNQHDLVTEAVMALKQGANRLMCVRVADGTETKGVATIRDDAQAPATLVTFTAKEPGSWTSDLKVTVDEGSNSTTTAPTYKIIISKPGELKEVFDNIGGANADELAANIVAAVNNGQNGLRPKSNYVTASESYSGSATGITLETRSFSTGTDGIAGVGYHELIGVDGAAGTRTGMYALRETGHRQFILAGNTDPASWADILAFAKSQGSLAILTQAAGVDTPTFIQTKKDAGIDNYHIAMVKEWIYINDSVNKIVRFVSPLGVTLGRIANLSPEQSPGNKQLFGIINTERRAAGIPYSNGELSQLEQAGIMPITNPVPAGNFFGLRNGKNASSDPTRNEIAYTRLTHFIAYSLNAVLGIFVCDVHTVRLRRNISNAIKGFLSNLQRLEMIGDPNGGPVYAVVSDITNNPDESVALGYLFVKVQVKYLAIANYIVIELEGGQTVRPVIQEIESRFGDTPTGSAILGGSL